MLAGRWTIIVLFVEVELKVYTSRQHETDGDPRMGCSIASSQATLVLHAVLLLWDRMPLLPITASAAAHVAYLQVRVIIVIRFKQNTFTMPLFGALCPCVSAFPNAYMLKHPI